MEKSLNYLSSLSGKNKTYYKLKGKQNPVFWYDERITVSKKQIELAIYIRAFRRAHNLSQTEMAHLCTLYGKPDNIKFSASEIHEYENYKHAPTMPKFQVLMNTMDINEYML